jgi:pyruvate kinase
MVSVAHNPPSTGACEELIRQMESLRSEISKTAAAASQVLDGLPPERQASARNLIHYLALRSRDLRAMQDQLSRLGLSSLGRLEPHVLATLDLVLDNLYRLGSQDPPVLNLSDARLNFDSSADLLDRNTDKLLGPQPENRRVHIMVTMPGEAADDYMVVHKLVKNGMNCMRINCSKDSPETWLKMIGHLKNARRALGVECRVLMDLGGPKLRTGPVETREDIIKIRPARASNGQILRPARIWLAEAGGTLSEMDAADANLAVPGTWLEKIRAGDSIRLRDTRGAKRTWRINDVTADGCWAEALKTAYITNGTVLRLHGANGVHHTTVERIPACETRLEVRENDILILSVTDEPGTPALHDESGIQLNPGRISLPIPEVYRDTRPGDSVHFDDGRISGLVEKTGSDHLQIRITRTHKPVEKLGGDRGINLPDTQLGLPALTDKDLEDLRFATLHADMVGLSFTNCAEDVQALHKHLDTPGLKDLGVVVKIETRRAFINLPSIILEALKFQACGVMIARGDLAVECGFERMAELQEEIMWISESAHVPVIWATQVLENLTRRGYVSRAEVTDAAMGQCAEAVMLNKGPHIVEAVRTLDDILQRMQGHHNKKRSVMRQLELATAFKQAKA